MLQKGLEGLEGLRIFRLGDPPTQGKENGYLKSPLQIDVTATSRVLHQAVEVVRGAQEDNIFLNAGSWLDGEPEFYGAEARDWVEGFVVAFEESDGAARGDCGGMARCREPGFPHFLKCFGDLGDVVGMEEDCVFERGNRELNEVGR